MSEGPKMPITFVRFWWLLLPGSLTLALSGCVNGASPANTQLTQGNWSLVAQSSNQNTGTFNIGGNLTQTGQTLSGAMHVAGSPCFDVSQPVFLTGGMSGEQATLTSADVNGQMITISGTRTAPSALSGTYAITGGCGAGDSGTVAAYAVPSITGSWRGSVAGSGGPNVTLSMALNQATAASADGTFALTGTLAFTGSSCSVSGTVTSASIAGSYIVLNGTTVETDNSVGTFSFSNVLLGRDQSPQNMVGTYQVYFGLCDGDLQTLTLDRQR
jgi:hypothetical protein